MPVFGALAGRPADLKRGEGELFALLKRYLDKSIDTTSKRKNCREERDVLIPTMELVTTEVLGRPKADGQDEIKPSLIKTFNDQKGEIAKWRTKWTGKAQLYEEKQARLQQLRTIMVGETALLKLKEVPAKTGSGGTIGKLNVWLATMRTWIAEETDPTRTGLDSVIDRLTFAAAVRQAAHTPYELSCCACAHSPVASLASQAIPPLSRLRDSYIGHGDEQNRHGGEEGPREGEDDSAPSDGVRATCKTGCNRIC